MLGAAEGAAHGTGPVASRDGGRGPVGQASRGVRQRSSGALACHAWAPALCGNGAEFQGVVAVSFLRSSVAMHRSVQLLVIILVSACAHGQPQRRGDERLAAIKFEGNHRLSNDTLVTGLALHRVQKRGGAPDPYLVQIDADRIRGEYLRRGYLDVDVRPRVERKGDAATVIYTVEEGTRAPTHVTITGLPNDVPVDRIRSQLPLRDGAPFDYQTYDLAKPLLLGVVQDAGYAHARLDAMVVADRANHTAVIELAYTPGPKCVFGPVELSGATGELATAVQERLAFAPGQVYSTQAITQTQRNLYGFGRFSTVRIQPDQGTGEVVGVKVSVSEGARRQVQFGGGFGIDPTGYEVRGRAGYSIAGWPFPLDTVSLDFRPAYAYIKKDPGEYEPRIRALAKLERADLFWTYTKAQVEAGYNYLTVEAYTSYGPLARLGFETPLGTDKLKLRVGWAIEHVSFRNPSDAFKDPKNAQLYHDLGLDHPERIAGLQQALVIDLRDHPLEPRLGAYGELHTTEAGAYAGSAYDYFALVGDGRGYLPLLGGTVLAGRVRYGGIFGDVPVTERFFSGGSVSQRGFGERKLSPYVSGQIPDPNDPNPDLEMRKKIPVRAPYGGAGLLETSIEARVPITKIREMPLGVVGFVDAADVTDTASGVDPTNLHWAVGGGLRLMTVVGPVRLDVGYRLNRTGGMDDPDPGSRFAYHLTIGEAF